MTDALLVLRKLTLLREHVARARRRREGTLALFAADIDRQDAAAMSLLVATQEAVDVAMHIAAEKGWGVPASYAEAFELLSRHQVIADELARTLRTVVAVRNRIAHGYASLDVERIWTELPAGLDALDALAAAVAAWLGSPGE